MIHFIFFMVLLLLELFYFKIADRFNIIDKPNLRSSHTEITIRGGAIVFPIAVVMAYILGYASWGLTLAVVLSAAISFIDDIQPLPTTPRFVVHSIAILLIFYDLEVFGQLGWLLPVLFIFYLGWVNVFNFMDGINGITVLYALVALSTFWYLESDAQMQSLLVLALLSCLVFAFFNVRKKAKAFAGDVGSISIAIFLGYCLLQLLFKTEQLGYLFFFSVYGVDALITILNRIRKKEKLTEAHRSHLYQYLANEKRIPHLVVSFMYALLQLAINVVVMYLIAINVFTYVVFAIMLFIMVVVCLLLRYWATKEIKA
ncbi:MAG: UDP-GlcNAc--UDP-phosphate GlcNAc-1-phosphate transferase [Flavobacterium sp.]|jgi:UDP-N-acetylmuramyl pentapeptide phosphotransferase/UDP-N-acetylglucosamine-1-phosphate transferase|nr:MAG: UDP-GlcNAc--UDP-phosphate GlcNAc-1-phosphate transferase [Flavobacterium sp.]